MKKAIMSGIFVAGLFSFGVNAQTLYVPSGTTGIGATITGNTNKIGIRTSSPTEGLEIGANGVLKVGSGYFSGGGGGISIGFNIRPWSSENPSGTFSKVEPGYGARLYYEPSNGSLLFGSSTVSDNNPVTSWQYPFVIRANGNTVIGGACCNVPTTPTFKLTVLGDANIQDKLVVGATAMSTLPGAANLKLYVNGLIGASEIRVSTTSWADYVFDQDYQLKPLKEVEQFIQANKHLPEVPSEKEVVENGVAMGEMLKIHMKKIEELTLYVIELQKQNEKLAEEMKGMKK